MTACETSDGKPSTPQDTVLADGRERVMRTGRIKTTSRRKQRREQELIESDQRDRQKPHERSYTRSRAEITSALRSRTGASAATGRATSSKRIAR